MVSPGSCIFTLNEGAAICTIVWNRYCPNFTCIFIARRMFATTFVSISVAIGCRAAGAGSISSGAQIHVLRFVFRLGGRRTGVSAANVRALRRAAVLVNVAVAEVS